MYVCIYTGINYVCSLVWAEIDRMSKLNVQIIGFVEIEYVPECLGAPKKIILGTQDGRLRVVRRGM